MSSKIQEIEDFELSLTFYTAEGTIKTVDSITSAKKSCKTSSVHKHCHVSTLDERKERSEPKWIWCKHYLKYPAQNTSNIRQHLDSVHGITVSKASDSGIRMIVAEIIEVLYAKLLLRLGKSKDDLDQEILW